MNQLQNNFTNTKVAVTNSSMSNYLDSDKLNDSTASELLENNEKSVFQKIMEKPNFTDRSLTSKVDFLDSRRANYVQKYTYRSITKLNDNLHTDRQNSSNLNHTRNGTTNKNLFKFRIDSN